jgi:hypothetical protein
MTTQNLKQMIQRRKNNHVKLTLKALNALKFNHQAKKRQMKRIVNQQKTETQTPRIQK